MDMGRRNSDACAFFRKLRLSAASGLRRSSRASALRMRARSCFESFCFAACVDARAGTVATGSRQEAARKATAIERK
jgi:hypothetical protein